MFVLDVKKEALLINNSIIQLLVLHKESTILKEADQQTLFDRLLLVFANPSKADYAHPQPNIQT